jgi:hypothetical protein
MPADPDVERAVAFAVAPGTPPGVYVTEVRGGPTSWTCLRDVVAVPATDGSPILRFRASAGTALPAAFRVAIAHTRRVLVVTGENPAGQSTVILDVAAATGPDTADQQPAVRMPG